MEVKILFGSSCVGKSTLMKNMPNHNIIKVETDDCEYWRHPEDQWEYHSIEYFKKKIKENVNKNGNNNMVFTCGALPLPNHKIYKELSTQYGITFFHILVICKNIEIYKKQIIKRGRENIMEQLLNDHEWRISNKDLYDKVLINLNINTLVFLNIKNMDE